MLRCSLRTWLAPTAVGLLGAAWPVAASAAWPPPLEATAAELAESSNWPNDPDYGFVAAADASNRRDGQWQLYSFIPAQSLRTRLIRSGESASGSSVDRAWRLSIGDTRVRIAVVDSGIRWDEPDLLGQVLLNIGELVAHPPRSQSGEDCAPLDPEAPTLNWLDCDEDGQFTVADYANDPRLLPVPSEETCGDSVSCFPAGDANRNGVFDAGDLLLQSFVADGVDDDANGLIDDIAGWDFLDHDNDPFDVYAPEQSHGTRRALDAAAATNNGIGGAGVCPLCRVIPIRVGDGYVAEAQVVAQGVLYAVDRGAQVILATPTPLDWSGLARAAVDYAWSNAALVVTSLGDLGSRQHSGPAAMAHTLPVHAITMAGESPESTTTTSFLAASPCGNYGAQNLLSAPSATSSREAAAYVAGMAGLVQAAALSQGLGDALPRLEAGELWQLLTMTAEDVDLPESREDSSALFWSQPGFDQNFGYGRVNAARAVDWVSSGRIPPSIDLLSPEWFTPAYADRATAPISIRGTVSARRAQSYDYWVEWAAGVQPPDGAFTTIAQRRNVQPTEVAGGESAPLGEFDIRSISTVPDSDPDSPLGENDHTVTIRVRAVAHYGGEAGDVPGETRRAITVHQDPSLLPGFPIRLGGSGEASPKLADIDGDGVRDIVVATSDGSVHVLSAVGDRPMPVEGFPFRTRHLDGLEDDSERTLRCGTGRGSAEDCFDYRGAPAFTRTEGIDPDLAREAIMSAPAIADLDADGLPEIVVTTYPGTIYSINNDGSVGLGWPQRLPEVPPCTDGREVVGQPCRGTGSRLQQGAIASPVLADLDQNGTLEVVQAGLDGRVHVHARDGEPESPWPATVAHPDQDEAEPARLVSTPAVADFDGDGRLDMLVGSNQRLGTGGYWGAYYLVDGRGPRQETSPYLQRWPVTVTSFGLIPILAEGAPGSPVAADFDGDGRPDGAFHGNASDPLILPADPGLQNPPGSIPTLALPEREDPETGQVSRGIEPTRRFGPDSAAALVETMTPLFAQPSAGDLNQDGTPDLVTAGTYLDVAQSLAACAPSTNRHAYLLAMWDGRTGAMLPGSPVPIEDLALQSSQAIADVSGDGYPEVIAGSAGYSVHAVDACGREPSGWPKFTGQWIWATPAVGDIDGDQQLEVVVLTRSGWLFAWNTDGSTDGVVAWESFHHDNRNTGDLGVELEQGRLLGDADALPLDEDGRCLPPEEEAAPSDAVDELSPSGGCACSTGPHRSPLPWLLLLALPILVRRRQGARGREPRRLRPA